MTFDIEETQSKLPASQGDFLCNINGGEFTRGFLEKYYMMYDSRDGRDALSAAYADSAEFSMTAFGLSNKYVWKWRWCGRRHADV